MPGCAELCSHIWEWLQSSVYQTSLRDWLYGWAEQNQPFDFPATTFYGNQTKGYKYCTSAVHKVVIPGGQHLFRAKTFVWWSINRALFLGGVQLWKQLYKSFCNCRGSCGNYNNMWCHLSRHHLRPTTTRRENKIKNKKSGEKRSELTRPDQLAAQGQLHCG